MFFYFHFYCLYFYCILFLLPFLCCYIAVTNATAIAGFYFGLNFLPSDNWKSICPKDLYTFVVGWLVGCSCCKRIHRQRRRLRQQQTKHSSLHAFMFVVPPYLKYGFLLVSFSLVFYGSYFNFLSILSHVWDNQIGDTTIGLTGGGLRKKIVLKI